MANLIVIGAGAAGVFGAINAKIRNPDLDVVILEGTRRPLNKVKISGGGRCNVTHHCFDPKKLVANYPRGSRELLGPFHRFQPQDTIQWFQDRGVATKVEADGRMFPTTNSSQTIIDCLLGEVKRLNIELRLGAIVKELTRNEQGFVVNLREGVIRADAVMLATGSAPKGHQIASNLGHQLSDPVPSLFTFNVEDALIDGLAGQSFEAVDVQLKVDGRKKPFLQTGPLLFTHWGLSGPAVLKLSAFAARQLYQSDYKAELKVNFLRLQEDRALEKLMELKKIHLKKQFVKTPLDSLSKRFWGRLLEVHERDSGTIWNDLDKKTLRRIAQTLTQYSFKVEGKGQFKEEFVTCGGVKLNQVDFRTMESKVCPNLYFGGEILDIDGITGGFNFQNAWTTSWIMAQSFAKATQSAK
ncbi:NAD(P)/FAD-dependent oxidoreductase [Pseudobacteriovorax antillogorgiicola]|uniref:Flavoprotein, HI0933 family n=1 Tax=Pseudobacteriovorax antillogorgiicola TaxID=1513793 RepID=A0A1Y6B5P7_9BACT|nr:NAD(P)/FAD-dependent oxidoreductase [Pseudobacteriovorax antillogorgiicola]TCS58885.1 hypothetical protein EDD56_102400 [Pseudobacteriovorax antillogorgiicola]SME93617.1 hypothetical protein SAMN06296036_10243 [Pseudobacteriovorax antillogorgiicola]